MSITNPTEVMARCHREGRGEMKCDVFQEIEDLKKEGPYPNMDDMAKKLYIKALEDLEKKIQKL